MSGIRTLDTLEDGWGGKLELKGTKNFYPKSLTSGDIKKGGDSLARLGKLSLGS